MHRLLKFLSSKLMWIGPLILIQLYLYLSFFVTGSFLYGSFERIFRISALAFAIYIINRPSDAHYKIAWLLVLLSFPVTGVAIFLLAGNRRVPRKLARGTVKANRAMNDLLKQDEKVVEQLKIHYPEEEPLFRFGRDYSDFPVYENTKATYFPSGEVWVKSFLEDLKSAKHFIFLEYYIVIDGYLWDQVVAILQEKVKAGVEVKIIMDDFGSAVLPMSYDKKLRDIGIEIYRFNPLRPALSIKMNNRDHRKIAVVDNRIAYTGGVNIADEYINHIRRFGYWKDSAIRLEGKAVWSLTCMFLGLWTYLKKDKNHLCYEKYCLKYEIENDGFFQPFADSPTDEQNLGLDIHINLINRAKKYIYIDSAYLVITDTIRDLLILAAKRGVDVRILTPHIPDKAWVFQITRGNYEALVKAGIKIYEFTPGFNHAKNIVVDDLIGLVGTINTDYRSYFLHFENGVLFVHRPTAIEMRKNFEEAIAQSELMTKETCEAKAIVRLFRDILNLFVPMV
ncbi:MULTISPECIES: cardiolipin synthase [Terrabacteria group]|uniref:cardiolipin synthase n=1 Tax=Bacillati TaxID=1783272 RepID=UPI001C6F3964|nr:MULTISPECIES: cardiolipin synthase [Terrabacteria group]MBW9212858.1 cardiolipin synthase [Trueperella sp. zg.1013]